MNEDIKQQLPSGKGMEYEPMLVAGRSMEQWIADETRKHKTTFWGVEYEIEPVIAETIIGDGLQLVYLGTIDQRPNYWLIRIDSKTCVGDDEFDVETILDPLEEEFGRHPETGWLTDEEFKEMKANGELDDYDTFEEYDSACKYPAVWWGGGHWGSIVNFGKQT